MADSVKAQKLAAARKKLKEYQQKSQKPIKTDTKNEGSPQNVNGLSSSTHSSINGSLDTVPLEPPALPKMTSATNETSPFHNYFDTNAQNQTEFLDPLLETQEHIVTYYYKENDTEPLKVDLIIPNQLPVVYSELKYDETQGKLEQPAVSIENARIVSDYIACTGEDQSIHIENEDEVINSNVENLLELSSQITELMKDDTVISDVDCINELEKRNEELTSLLEQEQLSSQNVQVQLQEYQNRIEQLQMECQETRTECEHKLNREIGPLQEQLQCHAQTVGILIGEKTELSTALSQSQLLAKQKVGECEELQGRLKTSRSRVADLERDLQALKAAKVKYEQNNVYEQEIEKLRNDYMKLKGNQEESLQDLLETHEKLNIKSNENNALQKEVQELKNQLSLAHLKIEQITSGGSLQAESQVEILTQHKLSLDKQVIELTEALKATGEERDQASAQYQQYAQQLNNRVTLLAQKLESVTAENERLSQREMCLVHHIGELERHLQKLQEDQINNGNKGNLGELKKSLDTALETLENLQTEKDKLEEDYEQISVERNELLTELDSKKEAIQELELTLQNVQADKPDSTKLLATMESDKVAASRAVEQNSQLKQQLEEMQQAFVKMSNDKLDLTEQLTSEEFHSKELLDKLNQVEHQLHTLSDAISIKDNELTHMRDTLTQQSKQIIQHNQLNDRLRHYEAQDNSAQTLQLELQKSHAEIEQLSKENSALKEELIKLNSSIQDELSKERLQLLSKNNVDNVSLNIEVGSQTVSEVDDKSVDLNMLDKEVAMRHLEEKFTRTMADIANLIEEKQRLEHIVTQLQSETDTIGEYIALYQHQRGILQQRTQEKDVQLKRLAYDRENVRKKLDVLNGLVKKLVLEKGALTPEFLEQHQQFNTTEKDLCAEHAKIHQQMHNVVEQNSNNENNNINTGTVEEIIALLSDIKTSNLIQPKESLENFHPCPWCSGQLLTV
ncbi:hypothetical protein FQA39_LY06693 [Lamprigera yunnana]|nr:hypothetical protein FQA39_LY06693 [Lamprigera yunnana]